MATTATSCIKLQSVVIAGFSSKPHPALLPQMLSSLFPHTSLSCRNFPPSKTPAHLLKASSEDLVEESKFVPLNDDDPNYGPPVKQLLKDLDGGFLEVICYTEDMIDRSLWDVMNTKQQVVEELKIAKSVPRICFLSGLTGEEMMMFIDAFPEAGLEPAVFAALVPNSADKPLRELIEEIMADHEMVSQQLSQVE